jgi:hypothetical protein
VGAANQNRIKHDVSVFLSLLLVESATPARAGVTNSGVAGGFHRICRGALRAPSAYIGIAIWRVALCRVIPAEAGIYFVLVASVRKWTPACAGVTSSFCIADIFTVPLSAA